MDEPTCRACVVYDESLTSYDFGPTHPMNPIRVDLTVGLAEQLGVLDRLPRVPAPDATEDDLLTVHDARADRGGDGEQRRPVEAEPRVRSGQRRQPDLRATCTRPRATSSGRASRRRARCGPAQVDHAANIAGGLHHAMPDRASGFCVYNDVAVAIRWLLANGAKKVAYVDVDVHHGDGVERDLLRRPAGADRSPCTRPVRCCSRGPGSRPTPAGPAREGSAVNVALPPGTSDAGWLRAFHAVVPPLLREFAPDVLVTQQGCDSHRDDPLAHLALSVDGQRASYLALHDLAHEVGGRALGRLRRRWLRRRRRRARARGPTCSRWSPGRPLDVAEATPARGATRCRPARRTRPVADDRRSHPAYRDWSQGYDPDTWLDRADPGDQGGGFPWNGLDPHM